MSPWMILGGLVAWALSCGAAFRYGLTVEADHKDAIAGREQAIGMLAADTAASAAALAISKLRVQHTIITNEVQREITEREIYRDPKCSHTPEQLRRINAALTGASGAEPAGGGSVPGADAAAGPVVRGNDEQAGGSGRTVPGVP